jgi:hypothetical protein
MSVAEQMYRAVMAVIGDGLSASQAGPSAFAIERLTEPE